VVFLVALIAHEVALVEVSLVDKESYFIDQFNIPKNLKDDGAYIDGFVYSKDSFFEDVHFKKDWLSIYQIAQKAMLINISDAIVMNAKPKYALLSVAIPIYFTKKQLSQLAKGFKDIANRYNIEIIGGDTIGNSKLDITITLISKTTKPIGRQRLPQHTTKCHGALPSISLFDRAIRAASANIESFPQGSFPVCRSPPGKLWE
jgi:thiamine-monophosphate kinase